MSEASPQPPLVTAEEFRHVIGHFISGVTVITAVSDGQRFGATASAVSSLSLEPPMLLVCVNSRSATAAAIEGAGVFAVNILAEDQDQLALSFARSGTDKFRDVAVSEGEHGVPLLDGSLAQIECRVVNQARGGTHAVFFGEVGRAQAGEGRPLGYFRGRFGRLGPHRRKAGPRPARLPDFDWLAA